jgi:hypothetical protein
MSALLLTGLVCSGIVLGMVVGWVLGRKSGRHSALAATDLAIAAAAPEVMYELDELASMVQFDDEGDGVFSRRETGIRLRFDVAELIIPYRFAVTAQGALEKPDVQAPSGQLIAWRPTVTETTRTAGSIELKGPFRANEHVAGYTVSQRFKKAFFMTKEETLRAYRDSPMQREYFGIAAYVPVRTLRSTIVFPTSHHNLSPSPSVCAFVGETEFVNRIETKRIEEFLTISPDKAELVIRNPRPGIRYAITWLAPESHS